MHFHIQAFEKRYNGWNDIRVAYDSYEEAFSSSEQLVADILKAKMKPLPRVRVIGCDCGELKG